jgi:hypothetical protein
MATSGGGWLYDQLREIPRGADPGVLVEWSDIIQKKANEGCKNLNGSLIRFKGNVNEGRFALDLDAANPVAMVCLLEAIQSCLTLMPTITREFYGALMVSLASGAEERTS